MAKFKVGDKVEQIASGQNTGYHDIGKEAFVVEIGGSYIDPGDGIKIAHIDDWSLVSKEWRGEQAFKKIGGSMTRCEEIEKQITEIEGWDKKADDVMLKINYNGRILFDSNCGDSFGRILVITHGGRPSKVNQDKGTYDIKMEFDYSSQCGKLKAFKKTLVWLLDNSDIKKDLVGQEVKAEIEGKVYKVKVLSEGV